MEEQNKSIRKKTGFSGLRYSRAFKLKVVGEIMEGLSQAAASQLYGISKGTALNWVKDFGSKRYQASKRVVFTALQRRQIVCAIEQGKMSIAEAKSIYQIRKVQTLRSWMHTAEQEKVDFHASKNVSMMEEPVLTQNSLEGGGAHCQEAAFQEAQLKIAALNTLIDVAEQQLKINIRKKPGAKQSPK